MLLDIAILVVALTIVAGALLTGWEQWRVTRTPGFRLPQIGFALLLVAIAAEGVLLLLQNRADQTRIEALSPRALTADRAGRIADACKSFAGRPMVISSVSADPEAFRLATEIANALAKGGFQIIDRRGNYFPTGPMTFGVTVRAQSSDVDFADCMNDALENIGKLAVTHDSAIAADGTPLAIVVNVKPLAD
ncbi:MAG TPA: hypothetical protein VG309_02345 [Rhizomicrobium sp.]|nr:hypothetical protein [Rhizomicrobium sp.]